MISYHMRTTEEIGLSCHDLALGAPKWRLHPGVLAREQFQLDLVTWATEYIRAARVAGPAQRWEDFHRRFKHAAYFLGLPSGRAHKQAATDVEALQEAMQQLDLTDADQSREFVAYGDQLRHSRCALADRLAMGVKGGRTNIFRGSSSVANEARSYAHAIVPCLFDEDCNEVTDLMAVAQVVQRSFDRSYLIADPSTSVPVPRTSAGG